MKKHLLFYSLLLGFAIQNNAQSSSKLGLHLQQKLKNTEFSHSTTLQPLLVIGKPDEIKEITIRHKGVFKFATKNICSVAIPYNELISFAKESAVLRIENSFAQGTPLIDTSRVNANVNKVHAGAPPLTQAYTGKNVVVGIIDGGIFFQHGDFRKSDGTTRIRHIWDQAMVGSAPLPYNYGAEWDSTAINTGSCMHLAPTSDQGHGTNVAGIAAGNGLGATSPTLQAQYKGIASDANIVVVSIDYNSSDFLQNVADAVDYIYKKADALGMPCVINTSIGTYYGSHDGNDLASQAIEQLVCAQKGRSLVAAAGNVGNRKMHLGYNLNTTDSLFTWFTYNTSFKHVYFDLWADTAQFKNAFFAIGCDNNTPTFLKKTKYYNILTDFNPAQGTTVSIDDSLFNGATKLGNYTIYASLEGGTYHIEFLIKPTTTNHLWRLQTKGSGRFDLWANQPVINFTSNILTHPLPGSFISANYRFPDTLKTLVSSWQNSSSVITVANYSNRTYYVDIDGVNRVPAGETPQDIIVNSSIGPTRDGRQKPNISAPGNTTVCTGDSVIIALLKGTPSNRLKIGIGGKHNRNGGTSMASPVVAGVVALYLEKRPTAGYHETQQAIELFAKTDAYTGAVPSVRWGYGKVNAFATLTMATLGCKDPLAANYNSAANIDTGGCSYTYVWNGVKSIDWNEPQNWTPNPVCCGPNTCDANVTIPSATPFSPSILHGDVQVGNLILNSNVTLSIENNKQLFVCKNIQGGSASAFVKKGKMVLNGSVAQNINGAVRVDTLFLKNILGATINGITEIHDRLILKSGNLNTSSGTLRFLSDSANHCATIDFSTTNTGRIVGNIQAQRFVPVSGSNQHYVSMPVNNAPFSQLGASGTAGFVTPSLDCNEDSLLAGSPYGSVFRNHEDNGAGCSLKSWEVVTTGNTENARGYSAYLNGNQKLTVIAAPNQLDSLVFSPVTNTNWPSHTTAQGRPQSAGWNLVGNPFLSIINLQPKAELDAQVNVWQTSGPYKGTYQTLMMGTNAVMAPFQGFFVHKTTPGNTHFAVAKTECVITSVLPVSFYKNANDHSLSITVSGNGYNDKTEIGFNTDATVGFDPQYDANKFHSKLGQPTLYTGEGLSHFSINTFKNLIETKEIPLGLEPGKDGTFMLSFDGVTSFSPQQSIHLLDLKTNTLRDLKQTNSYTFSAQKTDDWNRFLILFEENSTSINTLEKISNGFTISPNPLSDNTRFELSKDIQKTNDLSIVIIDAVGREIDKILFNQNQFSVNYTNTRLAAGIYFVVLKSSSKTVATQQMMVK